MVRLMPISPVHNLSLLDSNELYAVYQAIALADHHWRARAMYGDTTPPTGHSVFRPLSREQFVARLSAARTFAGGELLLRRRLSRQAAAYRVDVNEELARICQAA
jgi:hypothetical protein